MRISDWSSDVCSSDLDAPQVQRPVANTSTSGTLKVVLAAYRDAQGRNHAARVVEVPLPEPAGAQFQDPASRREVARALARAVAAARSEEHTSELQSLMRISYAVFCLKQKQYTKL